MSCRTLRDRNNIRTLKGGRRREGYARRKGVFGGGDLRIIIIAAVMMGPENCVVFSAK